MSFVIGPLRSADVIISTIDQAHDNPRADQTIRLSNVHRQRALHRPAVKVSISALSWQIARNGNRREQK